MYYLPTSICLMKFHSNFILIFFIEWKYRTLCILRLDTSIYPNETNSISDSLGRIGLPAPFDILIVTSIVQRIDYLTHILIKISRGLANAIQSPRSRPWRCVIA